MTVILTTARHRGEVVHIAGKDFSVEEAAKAKALRRRLVSFARRHGVGIGFVADFVGTKLLELMENTTTPTIAKRAPMVINTLAERLDIPAHDEEIDADLLVAWQSYQRDCERAHALSQDLDFELAVAVWINQYGWMEFWERWHWDALKRREFASALHQIEPIRARLAERIKAYKRRHLDA